MSDGKTTKKCFHHNFYLVVSIFLCLSSAALCIIYVKQICSDVHERIVFLERELETRSNRPCDANKTESVESAEQNIRTKVRLRRSIEDELQEKNEQIQRLGSTISSLQREMFSLNDRLRVLISYNEENGKEFNCHGLPGPPGREGPEGPRGPPGQNGRSGYPGSKGYKGEKGERGKTGIDGKIGENGINGIPGLPGQPGRKGVKGQRGRNGLDGQNGAIGATGLPGLPGQRGATGKKGTKGERGECSMEAFANHKQYAAQQSGETFQSVTYTVWGAASCPSTGNAVYTGQLSMGRYEWKKDRFIGSGPICIPKSYNSVRRRSKRDLTNAFLRGKRRTGQHSNTSSTVRMKSSTKRLVEETYVSKNSTLSLSTNSMAQTRSRNMLPTHGHSNRNVLQGFAPSQTINFLYTTPTKPVQNVFSKASVSGDRSNNFVESDEFIIEDLVGTENYLEISKNPTNVYPAGLVKVMNKNYSKKMFDYTQRTISHLLPTKSFVKFDTTSTPKGPEGGSQSENELPVVEKPTSPPTSSLSKRKYGYIESTRKYISCAVCQFPRRSSIIMIPARNVCPPSWNMEYTGYLMIYHHKYRQASSLCVNDRALGVSPNSDTTVRNIISQYLKHLRFDCTSFSCPNSHNDLVKCVVCSK